MIDRDAPAWPTDSLHPPFCAMYGVISAACNPLPSFFPLAYSSAVVPQHRLVFPSVVPLSGPPESRSMETGERALELELVVTEEASRWRKARNRSPWINRGPRRMAPN